MHACIFFLSPILAITDFFYLFPLRPRGLHLDEEGGTSSVPCRFHAHSTLTFFIFTESFREPLIVLSCIMFKLLFFFHPFGISLPNTHSWLTVSQEYLGILRLWMSLIS